MKTEPIYLTDSYLKELDTKILEVYEESSNIYKIILEKTIFYPMGGGQPTDQGKIASSNFEGEVNNVMIKDGEIAHYVISNTKPEVGVQLHCEINWDRRYKNMRVHSAGHVIDFAIFQLGYSPQKLSPQKGDHGKKPFIMYKGTVDKTPEELAKEIENKANEIVNNDLKISWDFVNLEDLQKEAIYLQPGLPTNKPLRMVKLEGIGAVADGGTLVNSTKLVGEIKITGVEVKDGNTIINYSN